FPRSLPLADHSTPSRQPTHPIWLQSSTIELALSPPPLFLSLDLIWTSVQAFESVHGYAILVEFHRAYSPTGIVLIVRQHTVIRKEGGYQSNRRQPHPPIRFQHVIPAQICEQVAPTRRGFAYP